MNNEQINPANLDDSYRFQPVSDKLQIIGEHIQVGKKVIETGKVNIAKKVIVENYDTDIPVFKEEVIVERKPVNEYFEGDAPGIRLEGETTVIPIIKEVIVKRMLLVEELHVTKRRIDQIASVHETLRREEVSIKRNDGQDPAGQINQ